MGYFGRGSKKAGSNVTFDICAKYVYVTNAQDINELRGEIKQNGITLQDNDGNEKHYDTLDDTTKDYPDGFIIVKHCPNNIGSHNLVQETPVYDNNGFLVRYNCQYDCTICGNSSKCGSSFCVGYSETIIGCKDADGNCKYESTSGRDISQDEIDALNCNCEDPIWVTKKEGDKFVVTAYSRKTGKKCSNSELLESREAVKCGEKVLLKDGVNFLTDESGNGIILTVSFEDTDKYKDCQIFNLFVNDNLVKTTTVKEIREHPLTIDLTPYNVYNTYKIEIKII